MSLDNWWRLISLIPGPVAAVILTLWYQARKQRLDGKKRILYIIIANRQKFPPTQEFVDALNLIDLVFQKHVEVVKLWHHYHDLISQAPNIDWVRANKAFQEMIEAMGKITGHKDIHQIDMTRFYHPDYYVNQLTSGIELQQELLRVLRGTARIQIEPKLPEDNPKPDALPPGKV